MKNKRTNLKMKKKKKKERLIPDSCLLSVIWITRENVAREVKPHPPFLSFSSPLMVSVMAESSVDCCVL